MAVTDYKDTGKSVLEALHDLALHQLADNPRQGWQTFRRELAYISPEMFPEDQAVPSIDTFSLVDQQSIAEVNSLKGQVSELQGQVAQMLALLQSSPEVAAAAKVRADAAAAANPQANSSEIPPA